MKIKINSVEGFKKNQIINFKDNLNIILGPSGSGKTTLLNKIEFCYINQISNKEIEIEGSIKNNEVYKFQIEDEKDAKKLSDFYIKLTLRYLLEFYYIVTSENEYLNAFKKSRVSNIDLIKLVNDQFLLFINYFKSLYKEGFLYMDSLNNRFYLIKIKGFHNLFYILINKVITNDIDNNFHLDIERMYQNNYLNYLDYLNNSIWINDYLISKYNNKKNISIDSSVFIKYYGKSFNEFIQRTEVLELFRTLRKNISPKELIKFIDNKVEKLNIDTFSTTQEKLITSTINNKVILNLNRFIVREWSLISHKSISEGSKDNFEFMFLRAIDINEKLFYESLNFNNDNNESKNKVINKLRLFFDSFINILLDGFNNDNEYEYLKNVRLVFDDFDGILSIGFKYFNDEYKERNFILSSSILEFFNVYIILEFIKKENLKPIILIDNICSSLDKNLQINLIKYINSVANNNLKILFATSSTNFIITNNYYYIKKNKFGKNVIHKDRKYLNNLNYSYDYKLNNFYKLNKDKLDSKYKKIILLEGVNYCKILQKLLPNHYYVTFLNGRYDLINTSLELKKFNLDIYYLYKENQEDKFYFDKYVNKLSYVKLCKFKYLNKVEELIKYLLNGFNINNINDEEEQIIINISNLYNSCQVDKNCRKSITDYFCNNYENLKNIINKSYIIEIINLFE
ncbi:hypothetical protein SCORR_v1c06720 [Spiroplasma corruscae]|uniref:Uncharacterized protein n=1 Tax=Spiroplasma corruscae TaxID=216934 RepID=A0A222EQ87_9MOLU|nr:ATP-binding protein [Spiroplasma corruscae]ASP28444.1 hypothetical protein SCORR_v1c06720 [Spiroplasma corruscae]